MDCELIGWCALKPEVQAAWAQAVFSVVAILIAVAVPWWQHYKAAEQRNVEAHVMAVSKAASLIREAKSLSSRIEDRLTQFYNRDIRENAWSLSYPGIPSTLMEQASTLHQMGEAGSHLIKAIYHAQESKDAFQGDNYLHESKSPHFEASLNAAKREVDLAIAGMRKLLDT